MVERKRISSLARLSKNAFSYVKVFWKTFSYLFDVGSDIRLGLDHFLNGYVFYCAATFALIFVSGWIVAYYSLFKSQKFIGQRKSPFVILLHIFLLGPLLHFWKLLKDPVNPDEGLERDVLRMRLLEGTTEAAPQLILQIWIQLEKMTTCSKILYQDPKDEFCTRMFSEDSLLFCYSVGSSVWTLLSMLTSRKTHLQYRHMLSIPQVVFIFFMYVFQLATRAYVFHTLTTRILSERWPSYYFTIMPIIFAVHALVIGLGTKKDGENDSKLLASTKIIAYDLDDDQTPWLNFGIIQLQHIVISIFLFWPHEDHPRDYTIWQNGVIFVFMKKPYYVLFHRYDFRYWLLLILGGTALAGLTMSLIWTFLWCPGAKIRRQNCCKRQSQSPLETEENQPLKTYTKENLRLETVLEQYTFS